MENVRGWLLFLAFIAATLMVGYRLKQGMDIDSCTRVHGGIWNYQSGTCERVNPVR